MFRLPSEFESQIAPYEGCNAKNVIKRFWALRCLTVSDFIGCFNSLSDRLADH